MDLSSPLNPESKSHRALVKACLATQHFPHPSPSRSPSTVFPFSYEDLVALDGGDEGMDIITHILTLAPWLLNASGYGHQPSPPPLCN